MSPNETIYPRECYVGSIAMREMITSKGHQKYQTYSAANAGSSFERTFAYVKTSVILVLLFLISLVIIQVFSLDEQHLPQETIRRLDSSNELEQPIDRIDGLNNSEIDHGNHDPSDRIVKSGRNDNIYSAYQPTGKTEFQVEDKIVELPSYQSEQNDSSNSNSPAMVSSTSSTTTSTTTTTSAPSLADEKMSFLSNQTTTIHPHQSDSTETRLMSESAPLQQVADDEFHGDLLLPEVLGTPEEHAANLAELTAAGTAMGMAISDLIAEPAHNQVEDSGQPGEAALLQDTTDQTNVGSENAEDGGNMLDMMPDTFESLVGADFDEPPSASGSEKVQVGDTDPQPQPLDPPETSAEQSSDEFEERQSNDEGDNNQQISPFEEHRPILEQVQQTPEPLDLAMDLSQPPVSEWPGGVPIMPMPMPVDTSLQAPSDDLQPAAGHYYGKKKIKKKKKKVLIIKKKKKIKKKKIVYKKKVKKIKKKKKKKKKHHKMVDHGKYYMYAKVPKKKSWEFGFKKGNKKHWIMRHEKGHKNKFKTKVKWYDKKSKGKGVHIWDYNHHDKKKKHHG